MNQGDVTFQLDAMEDIPPPKSTGSGQAVTSTSQTKDTSQATTSTAGTAQDQVRAAASTARYSQDAGHVSTSRTSLDTGRASASTVLESQDSNQISKPKECMYFSNQKTLSFGGCHICIS